MIRYCTVSLMPVKPNFQTPRFSLGSFSVARIGFGAMQLPGVFGPPDANQAMAVLRRAVELGVDHIDTAPFYGPDLANQLIREALYPYPDNLVIVSKVGGRWDDKDGLLPAQEPDQLRRSIEDNLRTLGLDQLAAVNLRVLDSEVRREQFDNQLTAMIKARDEGLIAGIGLSNITREDLLHTLERTDIVCVQNAFSLADWSSKPVLDECTARGIAFVPFFPLGSSFASPNPVLGNDAVQRAAARLGRTPAQIALAWTLSVSPNTLLIPGTSSVHHLEENLAVADIAFDEDTRQQLTAVA